MKLSLVESAKIFRDDSGEFRVYKTPEGNQYPSVSTVLGMTADKTYLDAWRARVGEDVANAISKDATTRGSLIHENVENKILGKPLTFDMYQQVERDMYNQLLPVLDDISEAFCVETQLYSDKLKVAGTVDFAGMYKGRPTVIDWKTSSRVKHRSDIPDYFLQCSAYAFMIYERTKIVVSDMLIAMTTPDDGLILFEEKTSDHLMKFIERRKLFTNIKETK